MLIEHLPLRLQGSINTVHVEAALEVEITKLWETRDQFEQNLIPGEAELFLDQWEKMYGLETDLSLSLEKRRERLRSKMRASGTATAVMIKNVVESFLNGQAEIIEHPENYAFDVKFISVIGVPENLKILDAALDDVKPAHLTYQYLYRYLLIREVHGVMTLAQLGQTTLDKFAGGKSDGK